ncbi:MAG: glycosyltransferase family 4 protein [Cyanobacteria bacterium J06642_11]
MTNVHREGVVRTLFLVQVKPYPLSGGVSLRNWQNINILAQRGPVSIFSLFKGEADLTLWPLDADWQHYDLSAPFRSIQEKVQRRLWQLRTTGNIRADWLYTQAAERQLRDWINQFKPTLIIAEEIWLHRYLPVLQQANCHLILDNHNVEGDGERYEDVSDMSPKILAKIRRIEKRFSQAVDQVWMCSRQDVKMFHQLYPTVKTQTYVVPNGVDPNYYAAVRSQTVPATLSPNPYTLIYLGRFSYQPNAEAASILLNHIYPTLKKVKPTCRLLLVGCDPTEEMLKAAQADPHVIVTGPVPDVLPYLASATVMAVPLQKGSGTRLKLLEAFAAKCPVVSTNKGAEGLQVEDNVHLLLRDSSTAIVEAILDLWQQPLTAQTMVNCAYQRCLDRYAWSAVGQQIHDSLTQLLR